MLCVPLVALTITVMAGIFVLRPLDRAAKKNKRFAPFTAVDHSVLQPLDRAAKKARPRTRFTIVDFLALTAHLSVPLALFAAFSRGSTGAEGSVTVLAGFGCFAAALIWWGTVQTASNRGQSSVVPNHTDSSRCRAKKRAGRLTTDGARSAARAGLSVQSFDAAQTKGRMS
jgi:hypothetical protein